jgi:hypothetical protein
MKQSLDKKIQRGVILYLALMIMTVLLAIGLGISTIILFQLRMIRGMGDSVKAFCAADTGIERILYEDRLCRDQSPLCSSHCRADCLTLAVNYGDSGSLGDPNYSYSFRVSEIFTFRSKGKFSNKTSRVIEIRTPYYRRVFITSEAFKGNLIVAAADIRNKYSPDCDEFIPTNGLEAADAICNCLAKIALLPGNYKAWLSTNASNSPASRFTQSTIPYGTVDDSFIAYDWVDLTNLTVDKGTFYLRNQIDKTEKGETVSDYAFTNVAPNGGSISPNDDCSDWTSSSSSKNGVVGYCPSQDKDWTNWSGIGASLCGQDYRLYCFQQ